MKLPDYRCVIGAEVGSVQGCEEAGVTSLWIGRKGFLEAGCWHFMNNKQMWVWGGERTFQAGKLCEQDLKGVK